MDDPPGHALIWELREAGAEALDGNELIVGECFGNDFEDGFIPTSNNSYN